MKHPLSALLFPTLCAVLCGVETWSDIPDFCEAKREWLEQYVSFDEGIPSAWTFRRIFTLLDPGLLEALLRTHASSLVSGKTAQHIAIDGKALRGSRRHDLRCLYSISACCHENGLMLAERAVDQKSNEITAIPLLLDVLNLKGSTVTIDAAGCQHSIAEDIIERKADYVLALKKNHRTYHEKVSSYFQKEGGICPENRLEDEFDEGHGRIVRRRYFSCNARHIEGSDDWKGLTSVTAVETIRGVGNTGKVTAEWRYFISSHKSTHPDLPSLIRNHWSIENKVHWVLDVILKEYDDRKSERRSAKAFATLKRIALNVVRTKDDNPKRSLRKRFKCAGWDNEYLLKLLT